MSYILDALRRADAERERGSVPGLHAQLVPTHSGDEPTPRRALPAWAGFAGGAFAVAAAIGAWQWMAHDDTRAEANTAAPAPRPVTDATDARVAMSPPPPSTTPTQDAPTVPSATPVPMPAPAPLARPTPAPSPVQRPTPAPSPSVRAQQPAAPTTQFSTPAMQPAGALPTRPLPSSVATAPPTAAPANTARAPAPSPAPMPTPARAPALEATAAAGATTGAATAPPSTGRSTATGVADERLYAVNELPDNVRREWPTLSVGGSMFAGDAASRFLIINGQILHEGERLAPELSLEEIRLKAAVLRFKGYRVLIRF